MFWKADNFRTVGMAFNKIDYVTMQGCYEDYECSLAYSEYIELFPVLDRGYVEAVNKKQNKKGAK